MESPRKKPSPVSIAAARRRGSHDRDRIDAARSLGRMADEAEGSEPGHSRYVAAVVLRLGLLLGLPPRLRLDAYVAGFVRDVGKLFISSAVLQQPRALTALQRALVETHAEAGAGIVEQVGGLEGSVRAVRHHHERWDGLGYPFGLARGAIPLEARVVAVADAFGALSWPRPYRPACSLDIALDALVGAAGTQFDPSVVMALQHLASNGLLAPPQLSCR